MCMWNIFHSVPSLLVCKLTSLGYDGIPIRSPYSWLEQLVRLVRFWNMGVALSVVNCTTSTIIYQATTKLALHGNALCSICGIIFFFVFGVFKKITVQRPARWKNSLQSWRQFNKDVVQLQLTTLGSHFATEEETEVIISSVQKHFQLVREISFLKFVSYFGHACIPPQNSPLVFCNKLNIPFHVRTIMM